MPFRFSAALKKGGVYIAGLATVLFLRGSLFASMMHGTYELSSLANDCLRLSLLMAAFHLLYHLVNLLLARVSRQIGRSGAIICGALRFGFVALVVFPALLSYLQLHPQRIRPNGTPRDFGLDFEKVAFAAGGLTLRGWFLPESSNNDSVVLLIHGLNANKENFLPPAKLLHDAGFPVLTFDLRAHGESDGAAFAMGMAEKDDIRAAASYLRHRFPERKIYALGYSAGAAALLRAEADYRLFDRVILDSPLVSVERTAKAQFLWMFGPFQHPAWWMGRFWGWVWTGEDLGTVDGAELIHRCPPVRMLLIHGGADKLIPAEESFRLLAAAGPETAQWIITGADHLQGVGDPSYAAKVRAFFS